MLVKRLNDSIARALEKVQEMAQRGPSCLIDHETDVAARKIESAEQASMQEWIDRRKAYGLEFYPFEGLIHASQFMHACMKFGQGSFPVHP